MYDETSNLRRHDDDLGNEWSLLLVVCGVKQANDDIAFSLSVAVKHTGILISRSALQKV